MKIAIASDHAGFEIKEYLKEALRREGHDIADFGPQVKRSVDYPDYALQVARAVSSGGYSRGILICGTGLGMSIAANKVKGVRAAVCNTPELCRIAREHNDANILTMGGWIVAKELAHQIATVFLETPFLRGRHLRRVNKIRALERNERS